MGMRDRRAHGGRWRQLVYRMGWLWAALLLTALSGVAWHPTIAHADTSTSSLQIVLPKPSDNGAVLGPVGANVAITGQGTPGDSFTLGYQLQSLGCSAGAQSIGTSPVTVTADSNGNFAAQFPWPDSAASVGSSYVVCAQDTTTTSTMLQSQQSYRVISAQPPAITALVAIPPSGTPVAATPSASSPVDLYGGGKVRISGNGFVGYSGKLEAFLALTPIQSPSDFPNATPLSTTAGGTDFADHHGSFEETLTLPNETTSSPAYLYIVSKDGQASEGTSGGLLPSLVASQQVNLTQATAPTATPSPTATATATATPAAASPPSQRPPGNSTSTFNAHLPLIIGLGAFSVLLFIVGVVLLASAAATPRG